MFFLSTVVLRQAIVLSAGLLACLFLSVIAGPAFSDERQAENSQPLPLIVASIRPLQLIVDEIAGNSIRSEVLINAATSPHDFSLTIAQAMMLSDADLLVWVGPQMESFLRSGVHAKAAVAMEEPGSEAETSGRRNDSLHGQTNSHQHHHADTHLWLSEYEVREFVERLSAALIRIHPAQKPVFEKRTETFLQRLQARHQANRELLAPFVSTPLVVYHDAYYYLLQAYGIQQVLSLTQVPHERLSAKRLTEAAQRASEAACLLSENGEAKQAERYAKLFEKPLVTVDLLAGDPETKDFDTYMAHLGLALKRCLDQ